MEVGLGIILVGIFCFFLVVRDSVFYGEVSLNVEGSRGRWEEV